MPDYDKLHLDRLDKIASVFAAGKESDGRALFGVLSSGESCYVALAANRPDLLPNDSIAYMVDRIGADWLRELIVRHKNDNQTRNG